MGSGNREIAVLSEAAKSIQITNDIEYQEAKEFVLKLVTARKRIAEWWDPVVKKAHEAWKMANLQKKTALKPVEEAEEFIRPKIANYLETLRIRKEQDDVRLAEEALRANLPVMEVPIPNDDQISTRELTRYEVTSLRMLAAACLEGKVPMDAICPNDEFLSRSVKNFGDSLSYPGVRVYKTRTLVVR